MRAAMAMLREMRKDESGNDPIDETSDDGGGDDVGWEGGVEMEQGSAGGDSEYGAYENEDETAIGAGLDDEPTAEPPPNQLIQLASAEHRLGLARQQAADSRALQHDDGAGIFDDLEERQQQAEARVQRALEEVQRLQLPANCQPLMMIANGTRAAGASTTATDATAHNSATATVADANTAAANSLAAMAQAMPTASAANAASNAAFDDAATAVQQAPLQAQHQQAPTTTSDTSIATAADPRRWRRAAAGNGRSMLAGLQRATSAAKVAANAAVKIVAASAASIATNWQKRQEQHKRQPTADGTEEEAGGQGAGAAAQDMGASIPQEDLVEAAAAATAQTLTPDKVCEKGASEELHATTNAASNLAFHRHQDQLKLTETACLGGTNTYRPPPTNGNRKWSFGGRTRIARATEMFAAPARGIQLMEASHGASLYRSIRRHERARAHAPPHCTETSPLLPRGEGGRLSPRLPT